MKIVLTRFGGRYGFDIKTDSNHIVYSSPFHYFLTPSVKSSYKYAWEACRDAWKLALKRPYHLLVAREDMESPVIVDVSAEEMLTDHYLKIWKNLREKSKSSVDEDEEIKKNVYQEIKMVVTEINTIIDQITDPKDKGHLKRMVSRYEKLINKYFPKEKDKDLSESEEQLEMEEASLQPSEEQSPPAAPPAGMPISPPLGVTASCLDSEMAKIDVTHPEVKHELVDEYAQRICRAIEDKHGDVYYTIKEPESDVITILDFDNEPILKIKINEYLSVDSIMPVGKLHDICPFHSVIFYQRYWKPIVEGIGHFCIGNPPVLVLAKEGMLPDADSSEKTITLEGWNCLRQKTENIDISIRGEKPIWIFEPSENIKVAQSKMPSKYVEQDYINAIVRCTDANLKSIYGRTGSVIQVIPLTDIIEIDVDFGRGLGVTRLTEKQIEIVPLGD